MADSPLKRSLDEKEMITSCEDNLICPWCAYVDEYPWERIESKTEKGVITCDSCGKKFHFSQEHSTTYGGSRPLNYDEKINYKVDLKEFAKALEKEGKSLEKEGKVSKATLTFTYVSKTKMLTFETKFEPPISNGVFKNLKEVWPELPDSHQLGLKVLADMREYLKEIYPDFGESFNK